MQRFLNFAGTFFGVATLSSLMGSILSPALAVEGYLTLDSLSHGQECGQIDTSRRFHHLEGGNDNTVRALRTITSCFEANSELSRIQPLRAVVQDIDGYRQQHLVYVNRITATETGDIVEPTILHIRINAETAEIEEYQMLSLRDFPSLAIAQGMEVSEVQALLESLVWDSEWMGDYSLGNVYSPSGEDLGEISDYGSEFIQDWAILAHLASPPLLNAEDDRTLHVRLVDDPHAFLIERSSNQENPTDIIIVQASVSDSRLIVSPSVYLELGTITPSEVNSEEYTVWYNNVWNSFPRNLVAEALRFADNAQ